MTDLEFVVDSSKKMESLLKNKFRATGKGLGELSKSVEKKLPISTFRSLEHLARIRNKIIHESFSFPIQVGREQISRNYFETLCTEAIELLEGAIREPLKPPKPEKPEEPKKPAELKKRSTGQSFSTFFVVIVIVIGLFILYGELTKQRPAATNAESMTSRPYISNKGNVDSPSKSSANLEENRGYIVQIASFTLRSEADTLKSRLVAKGYDVYIVESYLGAKGTWYRVRAGKRLEKDAARGLAAQLGKGAIVFRDKE